ncbi:MAG: outer membrane protein transport protein [Alphaproteobacteria bacterium]|nr:outer membrane protein transport protein [Alphaproteobacteria bacterium]
MMRKALVPALALCTALYGLHTIKPAAAAGFYIQEQSVSGLGSAFSGSATNLNDPSTIYFNPAGMTSLPGTQTQLGAHILLPNADLTDTGSGGLSAANTGDGGNPYDPTPIPNGYISHQLNGNTWIGLGVSAPFGLASEYDDGWFGRFDSTETELTTIDIQPTVAFKVNDQLSVGLGVNVQYADAKLENAVFGGTEGTATLEGDDWSYGYNLGLQYRPFDGTTFGASYRSAISHELEGDIVIVNSTALDRNDSASADLDLPDVATFGLSQRLNDQWTLMGQASWFGWNNFESIAPMPDTGAAIAPTVQNYQTTWAFAAGAEYEYSDAWTFRGGVQFDETPTTDEYRTSRTPDGDRTWVSLGATYTWNDRIDLNMAATYIDIADEQISLSRNGGLATVSADTEGHVGIVALGVNYKF